MDSGTRLTTFDLRPSTVAVLSLLTLAVLGAGSLRAQDSLVTVDAVVPGSLTAGEGGTVILEGNGFETGTTVTVNGQVVSTALICSHLIRVEVPGGVVGTAGGTTAEFCVIVPGTGEDIVPVPVVPAPTDPESALANYETLAAEVSAWAETQYEDILTEAVALLDAATKSEIQPIVDANTACIEGLRLAVNAVLNRAYDETVAFNQAWLAANNGSDGEKRAEKSSKEVAKERDKTIAANDRDGRKAKDQLQAQAEKRDTSAPDWIITQTNFMTGAVIKYERYTIQFPFRPIVYLICRSPKDQSPPLPCESFTGTTAAGGQYRITAYDGPETKQSGGMDVSGPDGLRRIHFGYHKVITVDHPEAAGGIFFRQYLRRRQLTAKFCELTQQPDYYNSTPLSQGGPDAGFVVDSPLPGVPHARAQTPIPDPPAPPLDGTASDLPTGYPELPGEIPPDPAVDAAMSDTPGIGNPWRPQAQEPGGPVPPSTPLEDLELVYEFRTCVYVSSGLIHRLIGCLHWGFRLEMHLKCPKPGQQGESGNLQTVTITPAPGTPSWKPRQ